MKKSECIKKAQIAVATNLFLTGEEKIEILRVLMKEEEFALFIEREEEKKGEKIDVCAG